MKNNFFAVIFVIILCAVGCNKKTAPYGPMGITVLGPTPTSTATPDAFFSIWLMEENTPVNSAAVRMAPRGITTFAESTTDIKGEAVFKIHSGGIWDILVPSHDGFDTINTIAEPLANTCAVIDRGGQGLVMELLTGSLEVPISENEQVFRITFHANAPKLYNLDFSCIPEGLSRTASATQVRNNNDVVFLTIYYPKSCETYGQGFDLKVNGNAAQGSSIISSNAFNITKNWNFSVQANFIFAKTWINSGDTDFWIGATGYNYITQNIGSANITASIANHNIWGDLPGICCASYTSGDVPLAGGWYQNLVKVDASNGGYDYCKTHDSQDASITIRFTDGNNLDLVRTFSIGGGFGELCGGYTQVCWGVSGAFEKCGPWPNTAGCSYSPVKLYKSKSATGVWGY